MATAERARHARPQRVVGDRTPTAVANDDAIMSNINYKLTMCARQPWVELDLSCDGESTPTE